MARPWHRVRFATTTTGTGTITVGASLLSYRTPASAGIPVGETVSYVITDGIGWEVGSGVMLTTTTMSRTLIESSTSALLSLSGNAVVTLTPVVGDFAEGSAASGHIYTPGGEALYLMPHQSPSTSTLTTPPLGGYIYMAPVLVPRTKVFTEIACAVYSAAPAGTKIQLALYNMNQETMQPTTRILQSGDMAADTTGAKIYTYSQKLIGGTHYGMAFKGSSNTTMIGALYALSGGYSIAGASSLSGILRADAFVTNVMPADLTGQNFFHNSQFGQIFPRVGIR